MSADSNAASVHVYDLDFQDLIEDQFGKLDKAARGREAQPHNGHTKVCLTFTKHFSDLTRDDKEARLKRWLDYGRQSEADNVFVPLEIVVRHMSDPCEAVRQFFNAMTYKGYDGQQMSDIVFAIREAFEVDLEVQTWLGEDSGDEAEDDIGAGAGTVGTLGEGQQQTRGAPR
ncbi:hypothetical protein LTR85_003638 [Meristemomyces frigidus]|nr:hypothetical protein LTR85_003638 [Meristemomyces frigidus]